MLHALAAAERNTKSAAEKMFEMNISLPAKYKMFSVSAESIFIL